MCFHRSRYREERPGEARDERIWDLFYRDAERSEAPMPVAEQDEAPAEQEREELPVGAER